LAIQGRYFLVTFGGKKFNEIKALKIVLAISIDWPYNSGSRGEVK
jgi:hypothetical protein